MKNGLFVCYERFARKACLHQSAKHACCAHGQISPVKEEPAFSTRGSSIEASSLLSLIDLEDYLCLYTYVRSTDTRNLSNVVHFQNISVLILEIHDLFVRLALLHSFTFRLLYTIDGLLKHIRDIRHRPGSTI